MNTFELPGDFKKRTLLKKLFRILNFNCYVEVYLYERSVIQLKLTLSIDVVNTGLPKSIVNCELSPNASR